MFEQAPIQVKSRCCEGHEGPEKKTESQEGWHCPSCLFM